MPRSDGRKTDQLRPVKILRHYLKHPEGSVLIEMGDTRVICTATIDERTAPFLKGTGQGWVTAEYGMLPRSTLSRTPREATKGKVGGRTSEIQRLIGRSLRAVTELKALGERTIWIDCDVIQADGGTRTASITGAFVALVDALLGMKRTGQLVGRPLHDFTAAVSVGLTADGPILDLSYEEDSRALVDMNLVMTGQGELVEIQGTGEGSTFSRQQLDELLRFGEAGIQSLIAHQRAVLGDAVAELGLPL